MVGKKGDDTPKRDPLADEIDALLKKLPHAQEEPVAAKAPLPRAATPASPANAPPKRPRVPKPSPGRAPVAVWAQVAGGVILGAALTQWPYASDCGWGLSGYTAAIVALLIVGGWCAMESWRARLGAAHIVSLVLVFWGVALAAEVLLPRIGYARDAATWRCPTEGASPPSTVAPPPPVTPVTGPTMQGGDALGDDSMAAMISTDTMVPPDTATVRAETPPDSLQD